MRHPNVRIIRPTNSRNCHHCLWNSAANMPTGTTPTPAKKSPTITAHPPQRESVVRSPSIQTVAPKRYEMYKIVTAANDLVALIAESGRRTKINNANAKTDAMLSHGSSRLLTQATPPISNPMTISSPRKNISPNATVPTDLSFSFIGNQSPKIHASS